MIVLSVLQAKEKVSPDIEAITTEQCFNIGLESPLEEGQLAILQWLLSETYEPDLLSTESLLLDSPDLGLYFLELLLCFQSFQRDSFIDFWGFWGVFGGFSGPSSVVEVGPRLSFSTAWSTNAVSICRACGLRQVARLERSRRYHIQLGENSEPLSEELLQIFASLVRKSTPLPLFSPRETPLSTPRVLPPPPSPHNSPPFPYFHFSLLFTMPSPP